MDYVDVARTNYFLVKDPDTFAEWAEELGFTVVAGDGGRVALLADRGIPSDPTADFESAVDPVTVAKYLQDGEIMIWIEIGYEGMRYLHGAAYVVRSDGHVVPLDLDTWATEVAHSVAGPGVEITSPAD